MSLSIEVLPTLTPGLHAEVVALCTAAYDEPFAPILDAIGAGVHVLGRWDGALVAHAMWVTRWLQAGSSGLLRTAYVEAVATAPAYQRRGFATALMRRLAEEIRGEDLGALSPSDARFYERLGWERWDGPLAVRTEAGFELTPDEEVMILRLPRTPPLKPRGILTAEWRKGELW